MKAKYIIHLILLLCLSSSLYAQEDTYFIQSAIGGKYLDVQWGKADNNTPLHLWPNNQGYAQKFTIEDAGGGYFYIKSHVGSNKYVHVQKDTKATRTLVVIKTGKGGYTSKWFFEKAGNGYYLIKSRLGTYLDVQWGSEADGTPIWMWERNAGNAQKWRFMQKVNNRLVAQKIFGNNAAPQSRMGSIPLKNLPVKVTVENIRTTFGDDGGDANFEYYTKIRIKEGWNWKGRDVKPDIYPKYKHNLFKASPSGTRNNSIYPYSSSEALVRDTRQFKVYISLYDYDDASGDDWVDIHPKRGTRDLQLYIDAETNEIFYQDNGRRVVGHKGDTIQLTGGDTSLGDELTASITLKIDWEN